MLARRIGVLSDNGLADSLLTWHSANCQTQCLIRTESKLRTAWGPTGKGIVANAAKKSELVLQWLRKDLKLVMVSMFDAPQNRTCARFFAGQSRNLLLA
jgi:hypothetical protein